MHNVRRTVCAGLFLALAAGLVPASGAPPVRSAAAAAPPEVTVPPQARQLIQTAAQSGDGFVDMEFLVPEHSDQAKLKEAILAAGGQVLEQQDTFVRGRVPAGAAEALPKTAGVQGVGINQPLSIDPNAVQPAQKKLDEAAAAAQLDMNFSPVGVQQFRTQTGATGEGIVVAVIDSGVDPGHPDLQQTPDGAPKLVDWKDFTSEGLVTTSAAVAWDDTYTAFDGRTFTLPDAPDGSRGAHFGYLEEQNVPGYINQDLDRNGSQIDRFGVLAVDSTTPGRYDTLYIDTNNDGSFRDEQPLQVYRESHSYTSLGQFRSGPYAAQRLNLLAADIDPAGRFVQIGFDSLGHGTWVSGVLGAYNPDGYTGVAPGVQIMALKALRSTTAGDWWDIKKAIQYAVDHGAKIINLSVGDLATGAANQFDTTASAWMDQIASTYGVLFVLAAGNSGPGLSSGATLGSPSSVIAAGAYFSTDMWRRDYNWEVLHESIWFFSGMGPRSDGTYLPSVVAPGGSPAPSPYWRDASGYTSAIGTSIATPHVSGAAALLMDAGSRAGISHDWLSVKQALEMGARRIDGFEPYEQGNGLIQLPAAFNHLQHITSAAYLQAQTSDGNGGILARSYMPGSSSFYLTNLGSDNARVGILSSESWVHPALSSMLLPPNIRRQLPLQIDPPKDVGAAHSAFVRVTQQNKYAPSLVLPVTHVSPIDLPLGLDAGYSGGAMLEAGRYQRYFFNIPDNARQLSVTARMPMSDDGVGKGTVQFHVFRPDGQVVHTARIGVAGDGLSSLFQMNDPVPGVWEVVIVALPDSKPEYLNPRYTLDVRALPGAVGNQPLTFSVPAGSVTTQSVRINNVFGAFTGSVDAVGLVKPDPHNPWNQSTPWRVEPKQTKLVEEFTLKEFTSEMQLEVNTPVRSDINTPLSTDTDLSLLLYHFNASGSLELYAESATEGTSHEVLSLSLLPPGTYKVAVQGIADQPVQYQYRRLMGVDEFNLKVQDEPRPHGIGEAWNVDLTIKAPTVPGRYQGNLLIRDTEHKRILAWYPLEVSVGQPALSVEPMVAQLIRGQPSTVVLNVRDTQTGKLLSDLPVIVNGSQFLSRNGQVTVPVAPQGDTQVLNVAVNAPTYQFYKDQLSLPVKGAWAPYPLGIDQNQENSIWRRKVTSQLP